MNKHLSPFGIIWKKLRKNYSALAGLFIIVFAFLVSVFCYVFMPDNSPDANEMNLSLGTLRPGTEVRVLKVPNPSADSNTGFIQTFFNGKPSRFHYLPYDSLWMDGRTLHYIEYTGESSSAEAAITLDIAKVYSGTGNFSESGPNTTLYFADGTSETLPTSNIISTVMNERIGSKVFVLGTDRFGRDMLSRILAGTRVSMSVGLIAVIISLVIGITLGSLAGFFRGKTDHVIMWLINVIWSIPTLLLVIAITMALGKGFAQVFIAVGLTMWVEVARVVRGQIFSLREMEFIEAGKALGYSNSRIILKHILPNVLSPVIVIAASNFASAILLEAGLSFLGMGAQPPTPSWGMMIKENYGYIIVDAAYLAVYPGLAIMIMVLAFTWLGNGLRDAIDSKEAMGSRI